MLLHVIGHKTWHFGDRPEQANAAKLGANFMIASAIEAMGEAASLVEGYDVSGRSFLEMITSTLFLGPVHAGYASVLKDNAIAHGAADHDWAALAEVSARRAGR
jgi:3-hydroxyisobutyrate dehydrogenase-like beta-hydroxyacid dehydrogenase